MYRMRFNVLLILCCVIAVGGAARESGAEEGSAKSDFALRDADGVVRRLSDFRGRWVVLEWVNFDCEPVSKLYQAPARRMQTLQQTYQAKGVVWLLINSARAGQSGHLSSQQAKATLARLGASPSALLFDATGAVGQAFRVQVTPEVRVLTPRGDMVYAGAVQSPGTGTPVRYLEQVLGAAATGKPIPYATQAAHGCRINYTATAPTATAPSTSGPRAPEFTLTDSSGVVRRLSDYRGKWVILEWVNYDCPFVQKQYHTSHRSMQALQARSAQNGIVWLSICSSARGKQGHFSAAQVNARMRQLGATPTAYLHDPSGAVGRSYGAKTTPDMRIISPQGTIEYAGGIDSIRSARASDVAQAKNYVALAIADILARRPIAIQNSRPYGCSVKY